RCTRRLIDERAGRRLHEQPHTARPGGDEVHAEVVVPIDRTERVRGGPDGDDSVRKWQRGRTGDVRTANLAIVGCEHRGRTVAVEREYGGCERATWSRERLRTLKRQPRRQRARRTAREC